MDLALEKHSHVFRLPIHLLNRLMELAAKPVQERFETIPQSTE